MMTTRWWLAALLLAVSAGVVGWAALRGLRPAVAGEALNISCFVYRDITDLVSRYRMLERQIRLILAHKQTTAATILRGLVAEGRMTASPDDIEALASNMTLIATYWLSFEYVRDPRHWDDGEALARGAYQVMALAAPYLAPRERALLDHLAERYRQ